MLGILWVVLAMTAVWWIVDTIAFWLHLAKMSHYEEPYFDQDGEAVRMARIYDAMIEARDAGEYRNAEREAQSVR